MGRTQTVLRYARCFPAQHWAAADCRNIGASTDVSMAIRFMICRLILGDHSEVPRQIGIAPNTIYLDFPISTRSIDRTAFLYKASTVLSRCSCPPEEAGFFFGRHASLETGPSPRRLHAQSLQRNGSTFIEISFALSAQFGAPAYFKAAISQVRRRETDLSPRTTGNIIHQNEDKSLRERAVRSMERVRIGGSETEIEAKIGSMPVTRAHVLWAGRIFAAARRSLLALAMIVITSAVAVAQSVANQPDLKTLFAVVGHMHNIDPELLEAIAEVESGGDPLSVSPKGALGLMQLMPTTASEFSVLDPFNPVANVSGAAAFLDYLRNRFANNPSLQGLPTLLAAYNAGPGAVEKYGGIPPYAETNRYVERVIERYANGLSAQSTAPPVLILGPKPYVIQLTGPHALQPEPVLTGTDSDHSTVVQPVMVRSLHGQVLAVVGIGTAPWTRRNRNRPPPR
jgi:hypothetical protein